MINHMTCTDSSRYLTIAWLPLLIVLFGGAISGGAASGATMENGDFEKNREGEPAGWKVLGPGVSVQPVASAVWNHSQMTFNVGQYKRVRLWLGIEGGSGSVWFDNARIEESEFSTQTIGNPSFEEGGSNTIAGWMQDPTNSSSRDTTQGVRFPGQEGSGASARVTSPDGTKSRIGQDIRIVGRNEPNREFVLSFDWREESTQGHFVVEVYGLEPDGTVGRLLPITPLDTMFPPEKFGKNILCLTLSAVGETGVSQPLELSADERARPWRVRAQVRVARLVKGSVALAVQPGAESTSELRAEMTKADDSWQELSLNFIPGDVPPRIAIRVKGSDALAYVDNVVIGPAEIVPTPKRLEWLPTDQSFPIPKKLTVGVKGDGGPVVASAIRLFSESLKKQTGSEVDSESSAQTGKPDVELVVNPESVAGHEPESYSLQAGREGVTINSGDSRGILDGLMTLLQLTQRGPAGGNIFLAAKIDDAPDLPFRGEYWAGDGPGVGDYRPLMDRLARLRYNAVFIENYPYFSLDNPESRRSAEAIFGYARSLGIEPVPDLESFGHAYEVNSDPNIAEGKEVENEKLTLIGTNPVALAHPNVIRTETSNIRIADQTGARTFLEGLDYIVIPGEIGWKDKDGFSSNAAPFQVRRTAGGRIPDGATVLAGYDYVSMATGDGTQPAYCPNEPRVYRIMGDAIRNTIHYLHPKYLHIGHDEIMQMGTDSRCRKSGLSNAENFAKEVWSLYRIAKAADPNIRVMMWDDMVNPYTHGYYANYPFLENSLKSPFLQAGQMLKDPPAPAADLLPRDIIITIWLYGQTDALTAGLKSLEFFCGKGYTTIGSPYARLDNACGWSIACKRVRDEGLPCMGVLHTSWSEVYTSLKESANTTWRVPASISGGVTE
jgi:hypothetical protein